jgi:small subunit ribosomal protein S17e
LNRIKRLSYEVLDTHKSKFGEDFADNKKALDQIAIIRSKGLKNEIAGYITKFIKKETREEKIKQSQIESARLDNFTIKEKISELEEGDEIQEEIVAISDPDTSDITE